MLHSRNGFKPAPIRCPTRSPDLRPRTRTGVARWPHHAGSFPRRSCPGQSSSDRIQLKSWRTHTFGST
jgi:hypothetical protein